MTRMASWAVVTRFGELESGYTHGPGHADRYQNEFDGYTIVMGSHRLGIVIDFNKIVIMGTGTVVETGAPKVLAETEGGNLKDLCQHWKVSVSLELTRPPHGILVDTAVKVAHRLKIGVNHGLYKQTSRPFLT